jgi:hypothetical protein
MKLHCTKSSIEAYGTICRYAYDLEFDNILLKNWLRKALQSLIVKLSRAMDRITKAIELQSRKKSYYSTQFQSPSIFKTIKLSFNDTESLALFYACEFYIAANPNSLEAAIAMNEVISPLTQLI